MHSRDDYRKRVELLRGTLDLIILQTLRAGPNHGYGISQNIRASSGDVFLVDTGSLYPALHRMAKKGWVRSEWNTSEHGQKAKYYRLTPTGRKQLSREQSRWVRFVAGMASLMTAPEQET